jgi:hypothetical protein
LMAQVRETLPRRYAFVNLQGVVPRLGDSRQVEGGELDAVSWRRVLPAEKLFAAAQPVQRVDGTVVGGELQLAEARNAQPLVRPATRAAGRGLVGGAAKVGVLWGAVGVLRAACAAARPATGHRWVRPVGEERWLRR